MANGEEQLREWVGEQGGGVNEPSLANGDLRRGKRSTRDEVDLIKHQREVDTGIATQLLEIRGPSFIPFLFPSSKFFGILQTLISATFTVLSSHCSSVHCIILHYKTVTCI